MSYKITTAHDDLVMYVIYIGDVHFEDIEQSYAERIVHPAFKHIKAIVIDSVHCNPASLTAEDIRKDVKIAQEVAKVNGDLTMISVMPDPLAYGISRMWTMISSGELPWESVIVKSREEAEILIQDILEE